MLTTLQPENYIHYVFGFSFLKKKEHFSHLPLFSGLSFTKIALHVCVCDSENYMDNVFENYYLGTSHFGYTQKCLRIFHFVAISGWSAFPALPPPPEEPPLLHQLELRASQAPKGLEVQQRFFLSREYCAMWGH